jgi:hypothetical protein
MVVAAPVATTTGRNVRFDTSGSQQGDLLPGREFDGLRESRAQRCADLDNRPLAANRGPAADRERGGQRFDDRNLTADVAVLVKHSIHHLGNTVAFRFGCEPLHQKDHDETAKNRRQQYPVAKTTRPLADIGVVPDAERTVVKRVVKKTDERPQGEGAAARHDAHYQRQAAKNQEIDPPFVVTGRRATAGDGCNREVGGGSRR